MQEQADLFELAFRHAGVGIALVNLDGRWIKVNDALCRMVGYTREELLALDFQAITHPEDLELDLDWVKRLLEGELESYDLEKRYLRKDGETLWILLTATLVRDAAGHPQFFVSQIQDVTRRRLAESEIEGFFEASPDLLAIAGVSGLLEVVNGAWERTLGWTKQELTTRPFLDFVHPEDRERTVAEAQVTYSGQSRSNFRNRYATKSGEYRWLEWNSKSLPGGRSYCVVRDVTERVEGEQAQQWLAALVQCSGDAVVGMDPKGVVLSWNAGAEALYGYTSQEMVGRPSSILIPEGETDIGAVLRAAPLEQTIFRFEARRKRKDGVLIDAHLTVSRVRSQSGVMVGWAGLARNVTDDKAHRAELARQTEIYAAIVRSLPRGAVCLVDLGLRLVAAEGSALSSLLDPAVRVPEQEVDAPLGEVSLGQVVGRALDEVVAVEARAALSLLCQNAFQGQSGEREVEIDGRSLLLRCAPVLDAYQNIVAAMILTLDVSDAVLQRHELTRTKLLLEATFSSIRDGVALLDAERRVVLANAAYDEMLGLPIGGTLGMGPERIIAHAASLAADAQLTRDILTPTPGKERERTDDVLLMRPVRRWVRRTLAAIGTDTERRFLVVWRDVTLERDLIAAREREMLTDVLTCIPNRRAAELALEREVARVQRKVSVASIVVFDIDHFKRVNDEHGHPVGDAVLCQVARTMVEAARDMDCVARWGGEEFLAVVVSDVDGARAFAERVRIAVSLSVFAAGLRVTVSAGVTQCRERENGLDVVARADRALYRAKSEGRDRVMVD
jgi:diguanylate cyclase (GGDEF)-like protein/PAS domain S-box-containing protein